jgi:MFS family permease
MKFGRRIINMKSSPTDKIRDSTAHRQPNLTDSTDSKVNNFDSSFSNKSEKIPASAWKLLVMLSCIATMVMYAETMLIPAIPDLIMHFHVSYSMSSWILTSYLIAGAVMTPIAGKLSDVYGRKKMLLIIMGIYTIGVSMAGFAPNISFMIIARAVQGIGMSMFPIAFSIIRDQFPRSKISIGQGVITSMFASGAVIGLTVGGLIVENYGWQSTFFTIIPISIALLLTIWRLINIVDTRKVGQSASQSDVLSYDTDNFDITDIGDKAEKFAFSKMSNLIDIKGAIALTITIISFLLVLTLIETSSSNSMISFEELFFIILGLVSFIAFVKIESQEKYPLVDLKLMLNKAILPANLIIMLVGFSMFLVFQTIPILVRNPEPIGFGEDAISAGRIQLPFAIVLLIFGPTSGYIVSKLGSLRPVILGTTITSAGFLGLFLFHSSELLVSINLGILSTGLSLTSVGAMNVIILSTPRQFSGISLGMSTLMRIIGSSIGPALAATYMQMNQTLLSPSGVPLFYPSSLSFNLIFLSAVITSLASTGLAVMLRQRVTKMEIPNLTQ